MNTLWFAFIIYILGMAVVLYVRPSLMFDGGAWKEFGLKSTNNSTTIFPFWMFVVLWSIASYVVGTLCVLGFSSLSTQTPEAAAAEEPAAAEAPANTDADVKEPEAAPAEELEFHDISQATQQMTKVMDSKRKALRRRNRARSSTELPEKPLPGYYVKGKNKNGKSTYIYYGKEPPFE